jgi:hypothetical protein
MASKIFIDKFKKEMDSLVGNKDFSEKIIRMATRGDIIEETTSALFSKYFPNRCGFGKGVILDSLDNKSKEVDIVIFDKDNIPPICFGDKSKNKERVEGFFPIESCWYSIEIKKNLNSTELKNSIENMNSVKNLRSINRMPTRMLLSYGSDLIGNDIKEEFERYKKNDKNWNNDPTICVLCVLGKGYLFAQHAIRDIDGKKVLLWKYIESQPNYFEAVCCIGGMINTITGQTFGSYLFDESNIPILEEIEL